MLQKRLVKAEMKELKPILEAYFLHTKEPILEVLSDENFRHGILPDFRKTLSWEGLDKLKAEIGLDNYYAISKPDAKRLNSFVKEHFIDMSVFEKYKNYKQQSLRIKVGKVRRKD